jgi:hypothetical protein
LQQLEPVQLGIEKMESLANQRRGLFYRIQQDLESRWIEDVGKAAAFALRSAPGLQNLAGCSVGITVGSRGISRITEILRALAGVIKSAGGLPELIPAMGSHGGGSIEGQKEVLAGLGITEHSTGCPIYQSAEVIQLGLLPDASPVLCNHRAAQVDQLLVVNRIKSHTDFEGEIESGLCKMLAIGLGGRAGAEAVHRRAAVIGHPKAIKTNAAYLLDRLPVFGGIGIVENWQGRTARIEMLPPDKIGQSEKVLLAWSKQHSIKLPFDELDVLLVGEIGKNISGAGMDTKVIGRIGVLGQDEPASPKVKCLVVLGLTPESHGNACGIGLADLTTQKVVDSIDFLATGDNAITSLAPEQGRVPCVCADDRHALHAAYHIADPGRSRKLKIAYIQNTAKLERVAVSSSLMEQLESNPAIRVLSGPEQLAFDDSGSLLNFGNGV